jgi:protein TonB
VEGTVVLRLTLEADGALAHAEVATASGRPELDQLAVDAAQAAAPFPAPPSDAKKKGRLVLSLPVEFRNRN